MHFLDGRCQCGQAHEDGSNPDPDAWRRSRGDRGAESLAFVERAVKKPAKRVSANAKRIFSLDEVRRAYSKVGPIEAEYPYLDDIEFEWRETLRVFRIRLPDKNGKRKKTFRQAWPQGDGWRMSKGSEQEVPFHLRELREAIDAGDPIYIVEGEKDVLAVEDAKGVATCNVGGAEKPLEEYVRHFEGADLVRIVADQDADGKGLRHAQAWAAALEGVAKRIELVRPVEGKDAADALEAGHDLEDAFELIEKITDSIADRFSDERTSISFVFDSEPPPREYLVPGFMPANESGLIVAPGGTGKGHFQMKLAIALALGWDFAGFSIPKPRGVILLSVEDDRDEMHRRMRAALEIEFRDKGIDWADARGALEKRIRIVDLRGSIGTCLGPELLERLLPVVDRVEDPGFISFDPLSRLLPDLSRTDGLNGQAAAGIILNELDAVRTETRCTVLSSHHVTKDAIKNRGELEMTAATGSQQLIDLSRWVLNLRRIRPTEHSAFGLPHGHYLEAAVSKSNYTAEIITPIVFERCEGGALSRVIVESSHGRDEDVALKILRSLGEWTSMKAWRDAGKDAEDRLSKNKIDAARPSLLAAGRIEQVEYRQGRSKCVVYAPADWQAAGFPPPPSGDR